MSGQRLWPIRNPEQIPTGMSDEDHFRFWETHSVTEELWDQLESVPKDERPRARPRSVDPAAADLDAPTTKRLRALAQRRNVDYRTLLNEFVVDRLRQEEGKEGASSQESDEKESSELVEEREPAKPRDWQSWAYSYAQEHEQLLKDPGIDSITLSGLAQDASGRLLELSGEIKRSSAKRGFPPTQMRRMIKGYDRLKALTERAIALYERKFGAVEPDEEQPGDVSGNVQRDSTDDADDASQEQGATVTDLRSNLEQSDGNIIDAREKFGA